MADKKQEKIKRGVQLPSKNDSTAISEALNSVLVGKTFSDIDTGIATVLSVMLNGKVNNIKDLSSINNDKSIFGNPFINGIVGNDDSIKSYVNAIKTNVEAIKTKIESFNIPQEETKENVTLTDYTDILNDIKNTLDNKSKSAEVAINHILDTTDAENFDQILHELNELDNNGAYEAITNLNNALQNLKSLDTKVLGEISNNLNSISTLRLEDLSETFKSLNKIFNKDFQNIINNVNQLSQIPEEKIDALDSFIDFIYKFSGISNINDIKNIKRIQNNLKDIDKLLNENYINSIIYSINKLNKISEENLKNVSSLTDLFNAIYNLNNVKPKNIDKNILALPLVFLSIDKILDEIKDFDYATKVNQIVEQLDKIEKILAKKLESTSAAIEGQNKNIDTINKNIDRTKEIALSTKNINKKELAEAKVGAFEIMDSVALLGLVMLIGGLILSKNNDIIIGSLKFGLLLSAFLIELMLPIALLLRISKIAGSKEGVEAINKLSRFVVSMSLIMLLGSLFVNNDNLFRGSLRFGVVLSLFLTSLLFPIGIIALITRKDTFKNVNALGTLIIDLSLVMVLGGLFMSAGGGKYVEESFAFAKALTKFMFMVLSPFMIWSLFSKNAIQGAKEISKLLVTCSLLMLLGPMLINDERAKASFKFAWSLAKFTALVLAPITIAGIFLGGEEKQKVIGKLTGYLIASTLLLVIGAAIGKNDELIKGAFIFTAALFTFVSAAILPFVLFRRTIREISSLIGSYILLVSTSTLLLLLGGTLITKQPEVIMNALKFTGVLFLFTTSLVLPFLLLRSQLAKATDTIALFSLFIATTSLMLITGAMTIDKYGADNILKFAGILTGSVLALSLIFVLLSKGKRDIINGGTSIVMMSLSIAILGLTFAAISKIGARVGLKEIWNFSKIVLVAIGVILVLSLLKAPLAVGTVVALGIVGLVVALSVGLLLLHVLLNKVAGDGEILKTAITSFGEAFKVLLQYWKEFVLGSVVALFMSAGLTLIAISFGIARVLVGGFDDDFSVLSVAIKNIGKAFSTLGLLLAPIALGSVAALAMSVGLILLSLSFDVAKILLKDDNLNKNIDNIISNIDSLGLLFNTLSDYLKVFRRGKRAASKISLAILELSLSFGLIATIGKIDLTNSMKVFENNFDLIVQFLDQVHNLDKKYLRETKRLAKKIDDIFDNLHSTFKNVGKLIKSLRGVNFDPNLIANLISSLASPAILAAIENLQGNDKKFKAFGKTINNLVKPIGRMGKVIKDFSNLTVTMYDENGKKIGVRKMDASDFTDASTNIHNILTCLIDTIGEVYSSNKELFERSKVKDGLFGLIGGQSTIYDKVITGVSQLGKAIQSIAKGIGDFANIGNNINSAEISTSIKTILTTLAGAIYDIYYDDNKGLSELFNSEVSSGLWGKIVGSKNIFDKVISGLSNLSKIISEVAQGISDFSKLQINTTEISTNIKNILVTLANAIGDIYNDNDVKELFTSNVSKGILSKIVGDGNKFDTVLSSMMNIGTLIANLATGLTGMAELKFPIYNEDGTVKEYVTITDTKLNSIGTNIGLVLTSVINGVASAYNSLDKDTLKSLKKLDKFDDILNIINNLSNIVSSFNNIGSIDTNLIDNTYSILNKLFDTKGNNNINTILENANKIVIPKKLDISKITKLYSELFSLLNAFNDSYNKLQAENNINLLELFSLENNENSILYPVKTAISNIISMYNDVATSIDKVRSIGINASDVNNILLILDLLNDSKEKIQSLSDFITKININEENTFKTILNNYIQPFSEIENINRINKNIDKIRETFVSLYSIEQLLSKFKSNDDISNISSVIINVSNILDSIDDLFTETTVDKNGKAKINKKNKKGQLRDRTQQLKEIENIMRILSRISLLEYSTIDPEIFENIKTGIQTLNGDDIQISNTEVLDKESESIDKFVKAVNDVNLVKVQQLNSLMQTMAELADKVENVDNFMNSISEDFIKIFGKLSESVDDAKETITKAERIEKSRQEQFNRNLQSIGNIMKQSVSIKVSNLDEENNITAGYEKDKK